MHGSFHEFNLLQSRRQFLKTSGMGLGTVALAALLPQNSAAVCGVHHPPRAKRVIFLFMAGAPSQLDLFDYKPNLEKLFNKPLPKSISKGQRVTAMTKGATQLVMPSMFRFHRRGQNGVHWSELLPHLSEVADDVCVIKSLNPTRSTTTPPRPSSAPAPRSPARRAWGPG